MTLTHLVLLGFAAARFSSLITMDTILEPVRHWVFTHSAPYDNLELGYAYQTSGESYKPPGFFGKLLSCYHCVGVWVSIALYVALVYIPDIALPVIIVAAVAQVSDTVIKIARGD